MQRRLLNQLAVLGTGMLLAGLSQAQSNKPISLVVGYSAGGSSDYVARVVGAELSKRLGRAVVVENVAGASGMLAAQKVLNAPADGNLVYMGARSFSQSSLTRVLTMGTSTVSVPPM